jgi:serine/threonine-protein kinase
MATVYRASRPDGSSEPLAVKVLHPHLRDDEALVADFLREGRVGRSIRHPNVVGVHECVELPEALFLVLDLVEGQTLAPLLVDRGALPPAIAVRIAIDLLRGLHAAHEATTARGKRLDLIHCDVTPHNVLVGKDGVTRLADFGIARVTERYTASSPLVQDDGIPSVLKGKLRYMAPEQVAEGAIDRRVDVWAAGVVCWEMLVGKRLFEGSDGHVLARLFTAVPPRADAENPDVPAALADLVAQALTRSVDGRFSTAGDFADALEAWSRTVGAVAQPYDVAEYFAVTPPRVSERRLLAAALAFERAERAGEGATATIADRSRSGNLPSVEVGPPPPARTMPFSTQLRRGLAAVALLALALTYRARSGNSPELRAWAQPTRLADPSSAQIAPISKTSVVAPAPSAETPAFAATARARETAAPVYAPPSSASVRPTALPVRRPSPAPSVAPPSPTVEKNSGNSAGMEPCPYCSE